MSATTNVIRHPAHQIKEDGAGDKAAAGGLVEVDVGALQLQVAVADVGPIGGNAVLVADDLDKEEHTRLIIKLSS